MILDRIAIEDNGGNFAFAKSSPIAANLTSFRLQDSGENGWKKGAKNRVRAGKRESEERHVRTSSWYTLWLVYFWQFTSTLTSFTWPRARWIKKHREQISREWFEFWIIYCLQDFPNNAFIWAKAGPLALYLTRRKDVFAMLPTGFGKSIIFQLFPLVFTCPYICKALRSLSSKIVLSPLFSIMRERVEQLKQPGFWAATIEIGRCY